MKISRTKKFFVIFFGFVMLASSLFTIAGAAFNKQINYQGKLTNSSGVAVANGTYNMEFILYDHATLAGAHILWTETRTGADKVQVTNGLFSVMLGEVTSLSGMNFNQTVYLGVNIGGTGSPSWDGEMTPRKKLGAVPAAVESERVGGFTPAQSASGSQIPVLTSDALILSGSAAGLQATGSNALTLDAGTSGILNLNNTSTGNILLGGGSASTGCTLTNSTGAFACTAAITGSNLSGTNTGDVTLAGENYLSIAGQVITANAVNLSGTNVTGNLGVSHLNFGTSASSSTFWRGDGTWATPTGSGVLSLSAIGSSSNANAATITGTVLNLEPASASFGGVVTTGTQTFAGAKTFNSTNTTAVTTTSALVLNPSSLTSGTGLYAVAGNSFTSGKLFDIQISSTGSLTGQTALNILTTGVNGTGAQTTYGAQIANTHSGTSTNVGLYSTATGGSNNYAAIFDSGNVGIGTTTPTHRLELVGGTLLSTQNALSVTGTLDTTNTAQTGVNISITSSGSGASATQSGVAVNLNAGYSGSTLTATGSFTNLTVGTGNDFTGASYNTGAFGQARGTTTGDNVGLQGIARGGDLNIGQNGRAVILKNGATNIGVVGLGLNAGTTPIQVGGYFGLQSSKPTFESGALIADNGATTSPILLLRDNGTSVVSVIDGGNFGIGDISPTALLTVGASDAFQVNSSGAIAAATAITSSGTITFSSLGAGIGHLSSGGILTSSAVDLSGSEATGTLAAARFGALTGDVTNSAGSYATTITNDVVTYAKIQNVTTNRLLGRATAGSGDTEEITLGTGLSYTGTTLNVTGSALGSITVATGTSGSDFNVSGSPVSLGGTVTLNIPDASASNRGFVTTGTQTFGGTKTFSALAVTSILTANSSGVQIGRNSGTLSNGDNNNVAVSSNASYMTFTGPTAAYAVTGFANPADGRILVVNFNINQTLTIKHDSASSSSGQRITTPTQADVTFAANHLVRAVFVYDQSVGGGVGYWVLYSVTDGTSTTDLTLGTFGSSPNANAASLAGQVLTLQPADGSNPGGVSTAAQAFAGLKTFNSGATIAASQNLTMTSGTGIFAQTYTGTTTDPRTLSATSLTTAKAETITLGSALTTGGALAVTGASYAHTANEIGSLASLAFTDATTTTNTSTTNGLLISPTVNVTTGASGTKTINGISVEPTFTACSGGSTCNPNGLNISNVTDGTGITSAAIKLGTGWDTLISGTTAGTNIFSFTNSSLSSAGALVAVGVNSGTGLIQGTGGLTVTGTTNINATGTAATNIGNSTGVLALASGGASTYTVAANTSSAFSLTDGATSYVGLDSRTTTSTISALTFSSRQVTITSGATATFNSFRFTPGLYNFNSGTDLTNTGIDAPSSVIVDQLTTKTNTTINASQAATMIINGAARATSTGFNSINISDSYALNILSGTSLISGTSMVLRGYGLAVNAPTGGVANYTAIFNGGNVGIGDTTPAALLTVGASDIFQVNSSGNINFNQTAPTVSIGNTGSLVFNDGTNTLCTIADAGTTGNLTCTGNITGGSTGTVGYWSRAGTTLSPAIISDEVNIGSATDLGAYILQVTGNDIFATSSNTALAFKITDGTNNYLAINTQNTTSGISAYTFTNTAPTIASSSSAQFTQTTFTPGTYNFTGSTNITGTGTASNVGTLQNQLILSGGNPSFTVTESSNFLINGAVKATSSGGPLTITNSYGLNILAGAALNGSGGAVTNGYGLSVNAPTGAGTNYAAIFQGGNVGIGTAAPVAELHIIKTTEQQRIGYDASNYYTTTVSSTGAVTFDAVGSGAQFTMNDNLLGFAMEGTVLSAGSQIFSGANGATLQTFRTTNGGADVTPLILTLNGVTAGNIAMDLDSTNGFVLSAGNGTRQIARAGVNITNLGNTAGSESGDLAFLTQSGGTAMAEKMRLNSGGELMIGSTSDLGAYKLQVTGDAIITGLASAGTQCVQASSTGVLSVTGSACGSGGSTTLQTAYDADVDGSDSTITLSSADDSVIISNPTSSGTDSAFTFKVNQQNTTGVVSAMDIIQASNASNAVNLTANAIDGETALAITANALTSGKGLTIASSATAFTGNLANFTLSGSNSANTGPLVQIDNTGTSNTNTGFLINHYATGTNNLAMRVNDVSGDTTPFVIDGAGFVGVGIAAPIAPMDVEMNNSSLGFGMIVKNTGSYSDVRFHMKLAADTGTSFSGIASGMSLYAAGHGSSGASGWADYEGRPLVFFTGCDDGACNAVAERFRIGPTGLVNVGGNASPTNMFSVGSSSQFQVASNGAIAATPSIFSSGPVSATQYNNSTSAGSVAYRTTNGGSDVTPRMLLGDFLSTAGNLTLNWDNTNQLNFGAYNGTRDISRAGIKITNLVNTAGSESGDLIFLTQSAGAAMSEKWRIASTGQLSNNSVAGTSALEVHKDQNSVTQSDANGILLANATAATVGLQSISPGLVLDGQGWKTASTAGSQDVRFRMDVLPVQGSSSPSGTWQLASSINGGAYTNWLTVSSTGITGISSLLATSQINTSATTLGFIQGSSGAINYRTTNGGALVASPSFIFSGNHDAVSAGSTAVMGDLINSNPLIFTAGNGTFAVARAGLNITNLTNTAGSEAADLIFLTQSGGTAMSEKLRIQGNGNVGIAATTPGFKLTLGSGELAIPNVTNASSVEQGLVTSDGTNKLLFFGSTDVSSKTFSFFRTNRGYDGSANTTSGFLSTRTGASLQLENDELAYYQFAASSTTAVERMRLNTGGELQIGSTSDLGAFNLQVSSATDDQFIVQSTGSHRAEIFINNAAGGQQSAILFGDAGTAKWQFGKQTDNSFFLYDSTTTGSPITISTAGLLTLGENGQMKLPAAGNVGIGSTTFTYGTPLEVAGAGYASIAIRSTSGVIGVMAANSNSELRVGSLSTHDVAFYSNASEKMRLLSGGNFGIANTTPGELLSLGTAGATKGVLSLAGNTSGKVIIQPAAAAGSWTMTLPTTGGTSGYSLTTDGSGGTTWTNVSGGGSISIGSSITSATAGSVLYAGASGVLAQDNSNFYYDYTNHRLGLGTTSPVAKLTLSNNVATGFLDNFSEYQEVLYDGGTAGSSYGLGIKGNTMVFNSGAGAYSFDRTGSVTTMSMDTSGLVGIGVAPTSDYLLSLASTTGTDNSRVLNITQADDANENSYGLAITSTQNIGSNAPTLYGISNTLTPTASIGTGSEPNFYGSYNSIDLTNVTIANTESNLIAGSIWGSISGFPTINQSTASDPTNWSQAGVIGSVYVNPTLTAVEGALISSKGGSFSDTTTTAGNANLSVFSYGIAAGAYGDLTTTGNTTHYGGRFDAAGTADTNYGIYVTVTGGSTNYAGIFTGGKVGIGTTGPDRTLDVLDGNSVPQLRLTQTDGSVYSELYADSSGDLQISATGNDIRMQDDNLWVCSGGSCAPSAPAENGNIIVETSIILNNNFRLKQTSSTTVDMMDSGGNIMLQFDEAQ